MLKFLLNSNSEAVLNELVQVGLVGDCSVIDGTFEISAKPSNLVSLSE